MEKPYLNLKELQIVLGKGRKQTVKVMDHLLSIAEDKKYYIPNEKSKF